MTKAVKKTRVLIIGGTGYIGSALYIFLRFHYRKYDVDTIDLEWYDNYVNPRNMKRDYNTLTQEELAEYNVVILLAGYSSPTQCENSGEVAVMKNNVSNFQGLLKKLHSTQKFIYASSITVYSGGLPREIAEYDPLTHGYNPYEISKVMCDQLMVQNSQRGYNIEFYGLRLATLGGPSVCFRDDIMINAMTTTAIESKEVKVFNPTNRKPMLYIYDLCRAVETIINCEDDHRGFYNLASYNATTLEIAQDVASTLKVPLKVIEDVDMKAIGLPTTAYDLAVSNLKFRDTFNFKFEGTTNLITSEIFISWNSLNHNKRKDGIPYV